MGGERGPQLRGLGFRTEEDVRAGAQIGRDGDGEMIGERQHPEHAIVGSEAQDGIGGGDARDRGLVREDDALRVGRRAGAEADEGGMQLGETVGGRTLAIDPLERPRCAVLGDAHDAVDVDAGQDLLALGVAQIGGDRCQAAAGGENAEGDADVGEGVRADEGDALRRANAGGAQRRRDRVDLGE
jgi:hypothetical protein